MGVGSVVELGVILPESALEKEETGLEGHGGPLRDLVGALGGRQIGDGEVDVLDHLVHDVLTGVGGDG
jgi:hypothetical protein